jgi:transcriptional regulator with XRE-family HTH domain
VPPVDDPTVARRRLRGEMRAARDEVGLTRDEAAAALDWSLSKIVRIETGDQGVSVTDIRAMLQLYKVTDEAIIRDLTNLARSSRGQAWWSAYRDVVTKQYGQLLGFESSASYIRSFHPLLIPGLLHTDDYAFELRRVRMSEEKAQRLTELLALRQEKLFDQQNPPDTAFIFGEEALQRLIGGPTVMRRQLRDLLEAAARPKISIQVIPLSVGAHVGLIGQFTLLGLRESGDDLMFSEGVSEDVANRDDQDMITTFTEHFEELQALALSEDRTAELITSRIDEISQLERSPG